MGKRAGVKRNKRFNKWWPLLTVSGVLVLALLIVAAVCLDGNEENPATEPSGSADVKVEFSQTNEINLGKGLYITQIGKYAGIYMEDGSDQPVSGMMMVVLKNKSENDLQLARFTMTYPEFTAEFEATNIPAGESVVLLERNRQNAVSGEPESAALTTTVFFQEKMSLMEDTFQVTGSDGLVGLENISGSDISGDIYVYYKNSASDLYYGGITYRVKFSGGLKAGEKNQMPSGHYDPDTCRIVQITAG